MPGIDQVAVDLLDARQDRRRRPRVLRRGREEERVAEGRAEGEHDRQDVEEERDLVAGVDDRGQPSAETYPLLAATRAARAAQSPSWRRSASARPAGRRLRQPRPARLGSSPEQTSVAGSGEGRRSLHAVAPPSPPPFPRRSQLPGDRLQHRRGQVGHDGRSEFGQPSRRLRQLEARLDPVGSCVGGCRLDRGRSWS